MKIGIFGDSFADPHKLNNSKNWIDVVAETYHTDSYGRSGSSLYYSIDLLLKHRDNYDQCILVVTTPGRIEINRNLVNIDEGKENISSFEHCEYKIKTESNPMVKAAYIAVRDYYLYVYSEQKEIFVHAAMVSYIKQLIPNLILLPVSKYPLLNTLPLNRIRTREDDYWNLDIDNFDENIFDCRNCHITERNNIILGEKVIEIIQGKRENLTYDDFVNPTMEERDYYIKNNIHKLTDLMSKYTIPTKILK